VTLEERAFRRATRRLVPFLFLIYVVAYLDRVNVSFAQLQLEDDLDFSDTIFGLGAGIFSLGYRTSDASWRARWPASGD
jgi:sugar phosphate permease